MFDSFKDYFLTENCKVFLSIIVNYHFVIPAAGLPKMVATLAMLARTAMFYF